MLKKISTPILTGLLIWLFSWTYQSCDYLDIDQYITDMQSLDTVFQKRETTQQYLYHVYSYIINPGVYWKDGGIPWVAASDECFATLREPGYTVNYFANNQMDANDGYYDHWNHYYQGIRSASVFLQRVYECQELNSIELKEYIGQAQFLRAYYYFELMKQYGPVCLVPDKGFDLDMPMSQILISRSTWDECVEFVAEELKKAASNLPQNNMSNSDFGKPTSGSAYAVLSRLYLYNASPLFNGNTSLANFINKKTGQHYINQEYQEEKWAQAAAIAKKVITEYHYELLTIPADENTPELPANGTGDPNFTRHYPDGAAGIDHYKSYSNTFNGSMPGSENPEVIFAMPSMTVHSSFAPIWMYGMSSYNVTQKLVDAYLMADGAPINHTVNYPYVTDESTRDSLFSGYILKAGVYGWYLNREMRFYASIGFNGSYYFGSSATNDTYKNFQAEFYKGGNSSKAYRYMISSNPNVYCMTGYLCRKFQHPEDHYNSSYGIRKPKIWAEYRLAEIYLNYVEALNNLTRSHTVDGITVSRDANEIKKYFNMIRYRGGVPGITDADANDPARMNELLIRERQVELAWEGHRYFDVRRLKIADTEENGPVRGMNVNKGKDEGYYQVVDVKEVAYAFMNFTPRKYFWPLPQDEVIKNTNLDQNPGW